MSIVQSNGERELRIMKTKHTPGPWAIHSNEFTKWVSNESGKAQIAKVFKPAGMADATADANAQLISAAPELLEALEACVERMAKIQEHTNYPLAWPRVQAMEAISKAKGGMIQMK